MSSGFDPYHLWLGIPPTEQPPDHYRLLGVRRFESDMHVLAAAGDRQTAFIRGFQSSPHAEAAQKLLYEISAAQACLRQPAKKEAYDVQLRRSAGASRAFVFRAADSNAAAANIAASECADDEPALVVEVDPQASGWQVYDPIAALARSGPPEPAVAVGPGWAIYDPHAPPRGIVPPDNAAIALPDLATANESLAAELGLAPIGEVELDDEAPYMASPPNSDLASEGSVEPAGASLLSEATTSSLLINWLRPAALGASVGLAAAVALSAAFGVLHGNRPVVRGSEPSTSPGKSTASPQAGPSVAPTPRAENPGPAAPAAGNPAPATPAATPAPTGRKTPEPASEIESSEAPRPDFGVERVERLARAVGRRAAFGESRPTSDRFPLSSYRSSSPIRAVVERGRPAAR